MREIPWPEGELLAVWVPAGAKVEALTGFFEQVLRLQAEGRTLELHFSRTDFLELAMAILLEAGIRDLRLCPRCLGIQELVPETDGYDAVFHVWRCKACGREDRYEEAKDDRGDL